MVYSTGWGEVAWGSLGRALIAETLGTALLVIAGCGAALNWRTGFDVTQVGGGLAGRAGWW